MHGRFQPPHNGHIRYILAALKHAQHLYIGICTPEVCSEEEMARTGYPCVPRLNPFSYQERVEMITIALDAEHVERSRYTCIPFPSDYKNLDQLILRDTVFLMSVTGASDKEKISYIKKLGYKAKAIITIPETEKRERSGTVRNSAADGAALWKTMVPPAIADYIVKNRLETKLVQDPLKL